MDQNSRRNRRIAEIREQDRSFRAALKARATEYSEEFILQEFEAQNRWLSQHLRELGACDREYGCVLSTQGPHKKCFYYFPETA